MLTLAAALYLLIAPVLAGSLVLVGLTVPSLEMDTLQGIAILAGAGFVAGLPLAFIGASIIRRGRQEA